MAEDGNYVVLYQQLVDDLHGDPKYQKAEKLNDSALSALYKPAGADAYEEGSGSRKGGKKYGYVSLDSEELVEGLCMDMLAEIEQSKTYIAKTGLKKTKISQVDLKATASMRKDGSIEDEGVAAMLTWLVLPKNGGFNITGILGSVRYLTKAERKQYEVTIKGKQLLWKGKPLNTIGAKALYRNPNDVPKDKGGMVPPGARLTDRYIFVMSPGGSIYAADWVAEYQAGGYPKMVAAQQPIPKAIVGFHHSSFLAGNNISAAGELQVRNGKLEGITSSSGHYKPSAKDMYSVLLEIRERSPATVGGTDYVDFTEAWVMIVSGARIAGQAGDYYNADEFFSAEGDLKKVITVLENGKEVKRPPKKCSDPKAALALHKK